MNDFGSCRSACGQPTDDGRAPSHLQVASSSLKTTVSNTQPGAEVSRILSSIIQVHGPLSWDSCCWNMQACSSRLSPGTDGKEQRPRCLGVPEKQDVKGLYTLTFLFKLRGANSSSSLPSVSWMVFRASMANGRMDRATVKRVTSNPTLLVKTAHHTWGPSAGRACTAQKRNAWRSAGHTRERKLKACCRDAASNCTLDLWEPSSFMCRKFGVSAFAASQACCTA